MPKRNLLLIVVLLLAAIVTLIVTRSKQPIYMPGDPAQLGPVSTAMKQIQDSFYPVPTTQEARRGLAHGAPPADREMMIAMIKGMIASLGDPYSYYIPPNRVDEINKLVMGRHRGTGIEFEMVSGEARIIGSQAQSPAHRANIIRGDRIVTVDGQRVSGRCCEEVRKLLDYGKQDSAVAVEIEHIDGRRELYNLPREEFGAETVQGLYRDDAGQWVHMILPAERIAYVRVTEIVPETVEKIQTMLRGLADVQGLILDLRDNPGGEFHSSLDVADMFLREGVIVTVHRRRGKVEVREAQGKGNIDLPLVVLVNERSASGAEIISGSLSVNDRAVIVGSRTRGKGCMQQMIKLEDDLGQINITTAEYYVGKDQPIARRAGDEKWGVEPHVPVKIDDELQKRLARIRLEGELAAPSAATRPAATRATTTPTGDKLLDMDPQLMMAVDVAGDIPRLKKILADARAAREAASAKAATQATRPAGKSGE